MRGAGTLALLIAGLQLVAGAGALGIDAARHMLADLPTQRFTARGFAIGAGHAAQVGREWLHPSRVQLGRLGPVERDAKKRATRAARLARAGVLGGRRDRNRGRMGRVAGRGLAHRDQVTGSEQTASIFANSANPSCPRAPAAWRAAPTQRPR